MNILPFIAVTALLAGFTRADDTVIDRFSWQELAAGGKLSTGIVVSEDGHPVALKIENPGGQPMQANVLTVEQPKITTPFYALTGEVRYEQVEGDGFFEMWSHFGAGAYFSRTLGGSGPMAALRGSSGWRAFTLPFDGTGAKAPLSRIVMNVQLPGKGTVYLREVRLVENTSPVVFGKLPGAWWSDRSAGWIGGIGGTFLGCFAGLIGWLAGRGKAAGFVVNAAKILIVAGIAATIAGLIAAALRQPYGVWYPLLLLGVLSVAIFPFQLRRYRAQFREIELRRMSSLDLPAHH